MSGLKVLSTISTVVEYLDDPIMIYNTHNPNAPKLPKAFNQTRNHVPTLRHTLYLYKADLVTTNIKSKPSDFSEHLGDALEDCETKAWKIKQMFECVFPADDSTWEKRYTRCIGILGGPGNNIEELMISVTGLVQSIVCDYAVVPVRPELVIELEGIRVEMESG